MARFGNTDIRTLGLTLLMYVLLIGNFAWYCTAPFSLIVHVLIATVAVHLAFTVWHEGVHQTVSRYRLVNDLTGFFGVFPYMAPFYLERWFHLQHHALLNKPDDPNYIYTDGPFWSLPFRYPRVLKYAQQRMAADPRTPRQKLADHCGVGAVLVVYLVAAWQGAFFDLVALWFVPVVISKVVMDWYINYLPHVGLPPHRFHGTRIIDVRWLTFATLGHNFHAIHHLWPSIPWHRYHATFVEQRDYLREHGVPIETRIPWIHTAGHDVERPDSLAD